MVWLAALASASSLYESPATSERHGHVQFGGLPLPGATVTASQGDKKIVALTDAAGAYSFPDLPDGVWTIEVEMLCFVPVKQEVTLAVDAAIPDWDLKLLPLDQIKAAAGPQPESPVSVAINAPATPAASDAPPPKKSKNAPPPPANTPGGFQRTDVNASNPAAAAQANAPAANANTPASDDLSKSAADGFLVNGTSNNGASSPFATNPAFGNNRLGMRGLYNGGFGFTLNDSVLNANSYSLTGQDTPKPSYNLFSGLATLGGPLKIGHLFVTPPNFFVNYQWTRNQNATIGTGKMPTEAQRAGDFSTLGTAITDPTTGLAFPGNIIPQTRISPQALSLLSLYPLPNFSGTQYNYQRALVSPQHQDQMQSRLSKNINRKNQIWGVFQFQSIRSDTPSLLDFIDTSDTFNLTTNVNWRHSFTNRLFATFQYQFSRASNRGIPNFAYKENISGEAGITGNNQQPQNWGPPALNFLSGIYPLSDSNESVTHYQTSAVSDNNYWIHGRHNIQFGGDFKKQQFNINGQSDPRGVFTFTGAATGNDFAGFLLGIPDTSQLAFGNADKYLRDTIYDGYITDDLRVSPSLTMNVGVRWDYWSPITELYGRLVNLDVVPGYSNAAPVVANDPVGPLTGMRYPDSLMKPDKHEFQPRIGISWRPLPASSMVVRLGYGVNYNTSVYQSIAGQLDQQAPLSKSLSVPNSPSDPLTLANGFNASPNISTDNFGIDPNFRIGYVQTWKAEVQRDLPGALIMTATYLGIKGTRGVQEFYPNTYPYGGVNPCPTCLSGYAYMTSNGNSTREAGQMQVRRRLHNGITASVLYVYSKSIDDAALGGRGQGSLAVAQNWLDLSGERGLSSFDQRHQVTFSGQYTTGMGMHGGTLLSGWRGGLFKEWTFLTNITAGTGNPLTPTYFVPTEGTGNVGSLRPEYTGAPLYDAPPGLSLNPAAYAAPALGTYGNAGRDSITGPFQFSLNVSMARVFRLNDRFNLDLRVDSTNTLNHVTYPSWITQFGSAQFGLPATANAMRQLTTTVRVRF
ncbi:MAG: carboxypeptidase regulatory-like domain-containing protein [Bryobacteraceae bacterium]